MGHTGRLLTAFGFGLVLLNLSSCASGNSATSDPRPSAPTSKLELAPINKVPVIHVFVALADNINQGIVPVSASLGNGDNPKTNLYWGAAFGVKTFFSKSRDWQLVSAIQNPIPAILERCVFKHRNENLFLIADAYQGKEIAKATTDFLGAAAGHPGEELTIDHTEYSTHGSADLIAYNGHDG